MKWSGESAERYSPTSDEWQLLPPMLQPRKDPQGVVIIGGCLYIIDGIDYGRDGEFGELEWGPVAALEPCSSELWRPFGSFFE